jgi:hypothetical protein
VSNILDGKSDDEIRRAATWWFTAQEVYLRGEAVPPSVFLISTEGITKSDIEWAQKLIAEHPEWK